MRNFLTSVAAAASVAFVASTPAHSAYIDVAANQVISEGGEVFLRFDGETAVHHTNVVLERSGDILFNNQLAAIGEVFSLGVFAAGEVISFRFDNLTSGLSFFSGGAESNVDNIAHVHLSQNDDGSVTLGYEDLFGGGDFDFDDVVATISESSDMSMPVPGAFWLLASGLAGIGFASRRRRQ